MPLTTSTPGGEALQALLDQRTVGQLLLALDLGGTFVFAISGAMLGVKRRLDIFGVLVLSFAACSAGGIVRDLLIGSVPPAAISDWRYFAVAVLAGVATFFWYSPVARLRTAIAMFDAAGLALFAVSGTQKALAAGLNPVMSALLGMLTGIGGGIVRDLLVARTPAVLRGELYAVAALAGAAVVVAGHLLDLPAVPTALAGAGSCFGLRLLAIRRGWRLPVARPRGEPGSEDEH
uniref:trimeric intracellular cation channel family protein n=1 Tax=uncultured Sphingomonas sp. TaxID=158754 RepID=UPI0025F5DEFD|nr:trimeric intracellular cation channel family protein [uncultured Sphingomonas sp.]